MLVCEADTPLGPELSPAPKPSPPTFFAAAAAAAA